MQTNLQSNPSTSFYFQANQISKYFELSLSVCPGHGDFSPETFYLPLRICQK